MYNVYKNGAKVGTTNDKQYLFTGLEPNTSYQLGVSRVVDGRESTVVEIEAFAEEEVETPEELEEVAEMATQSSDDVSDYHVGGGWYELPNGDRVRGKDNAIEALAQI